MESLLKRLQQAKTTSDDLPIWEAIRNDLLPKFGQTDDSQIEETYLNQAIDYQDDENPFPGKTVPDLCTSQSDMDMFVHSVFDRRFGWSEADQNGNLLRGKDLRKRESSHSNAQKKTRINGRMDEFIKWFHYEKNYAGMLMSLKHTIRQASNKPVVRNQTVIHLMDWLRCIVINVPSDQHEIVQDVIILGVTDIWSAIRNACVSRLSHVVEHFSLSQLQQFFNVLVQICVNSESSWQSKEGAIMAINNLVRRFQWVGFLPGEDITTHDSSAKPEFYLKFGREELAAMPDFISSQMHGMIFGLLAHPQLTVRENATKAYSSYISRCEFKEAQSSFNEVIYQLRRVIPDDTPFSLSTISKSDFTFMDAYQADGLLQVCVHLVKHIPPGHLLPEWPKYFSTFSLYLMHHASTVRLSTSSIFKYLVARDSGNPILLKLILQGLSVDWIPNHEFLNQPLGNDAPKFGGIESRNDVSTIQQTEQDDYSCAWEWREGRLLAYELIFQFLIKNHWLYTFGSSQLSAVGPPNSPRLDSSRGDSEQNDTQTRSVKVSSSYGSPTLHKSLRPTLSSSESVSHPTSDNIGSTNLVMASVLESADEGGRECPEFCMPVRRNSLSSTSGAWEIPVSRRGSHKHHKGKLDKVDEMPAPHTGTPAQYARFNRPRHSISISNPTKDIIETLSPFKAKRLAFSKHRTLTQASSSAGAAELSTQRLFTRLPTITGYGDQPSLRTLVRHYSYYTTTPKSKSVIMGPASTKAASLLMHSLAMDIHSDQEGQEGRSNSPICSPRGNNNSGDCDWVNQIELENMSKLLEDVMFQSIESMADVRWELRRMGQQLLPCVVEVIRWYDMRVLERLWESHLSGPTTLLTYGSCLALRHSLSHAARLQAMLLDPPASWQDPELCRHITLRITESIKQNLSSWVVPVHLLLNRPVLDRLTAVAMATILVSHTHFSLRSELKTMHINTILDVICAIFNKVHPVEAAQVKTLTVHNERKNLSVTTEGFLCCSARADGTTKFHESHMEKYILSEVLPAFCRFLRFSPFVQASSVLPVLMFYLGNYSEDDTLSKSLVETISTLTQQCNAHVMKTNAGDKVLTHCMTAMDQLAHLLTDKSVDLQTAKQAMDFYLQLASHIPFSKHADLILRAISARMIQTSSSLSSPRNINGNHGDLALRSNDIPINTNGEADELSSEEEDALDLAAEVLMQESQSLNVSGGSGTSAKVSIGSTDGQELRLGSVESQESSDWDDWSDDEEEDQSAFSAAFSEFLTNLKAQIETPENLLDFKKTLAAMPAKDRRQIEALL